MGQRRKNKNQTKKPKPSAPRLRTIDERRKEVKIVLTKLNELGLTTAHEPVYKLIATMQCYINEGKEQTINIPYPEIERRIVGTLTEYINEPVIIKLKSI